MRTWNLVPVGLATGLVALTVAAGAGLGLSASAEPEPVPTVTATATATITATATVTAKPKVRKHKHKAQPRATATRRPTVKSTPAPTVTRTPRATRSTARPVVTGTPQAIAKQLLAARGWADQWPSFNALEMGEAGWNPRAVNPSSGACGLPQALPCSKLPNGVNSTVTQQLTWMLDYIERSYGTPANAYAKWLARSPHWY